MTTNVEAALTPPADGEGHKVEVKAFRVSDIPDAMALKGWTQAEQIMRRWFTGAPYVMTKAVKKGDKKASELPAEQVMTDLPFEWLFTGSARVKPVVDDVVAKLKRVNNYNALVGRVLTSSPIEKQLSNGLVQLMRRLSKLGAIDLEQGQLRNCYFDFSAKSAIELDECAQFNYLTVGTTPKEQAIDAMDDVYGALGGFAIKIAATSMWTVREPGVPAKIVIDEIGLYVRDTYDFLNSGGEDQFLGYWNATDVRDATGVLARPAQRYTDLKASTSPRIEDQGKTFYRVTNDSFNQYRALHNKGGDFLIFSTVHKVKVDIEIPIGKIDIAEFVDRSGGAK
ncbi:hypothetical protein KSS94_14600 [Pseudomonas fakonensis]|uniref:Phage major capsid protein E n=1 Tax=Pseudomonas fakonensis TaxID=2842355 RepID=A0ABX8N0D3_9PSED|nr:DUF6402 family protein [Pseudomonas fakonensis]QXH49183.1 hypothetical protein KSS94_14600 [Pseudomonas fakonensis]